MIPCKIEEITSNDLKAVSECFDSLNQSLTELLQSTSSFVSQVDDLRERITRLTEEMRQMDLELSQ